MATPGKFDNEAFELTRQHIDDFIQRTAELTKNENNEVKDLYNEFLKDTELSVGKTNKKTAQNLSSFFECILSLLLLLRAKNRLKISKETILNL